MATGLDNIIESILVEAKASAEKVLKDAELVASKRLKEAEEEASKKKSSVLSAANSAVLKIKQRAASKAAMNRKSAFLKTKIDLIDEVILRSKTSICGLGDFEYFDIMLKILGRYLKKNCRAVILFSKKDFLRLTDELKEKIKDVAKKSDVDLEFSKDFLKNESGGFILKYGNIEENCTLDSLFLEKREELVTMLNNLLFG